MNRQTQRQPDKKQINESVKFQKLEKQKDQWKDSKRNR